MSINIDNEINRGIAIFVESLKYKGCDISPYYKPDEVASQIQARRRIKVNKDSFSSICTYLTFPEMVGFSTLCKEFMEYYPHMWSIAQKSLYSESLIPSYDYNNIRKNIALDYYYWELSVKKNSQWVSINTEENIMLKLEDSILADKYTDIYDENTIKIIMDENELQCRTEFRDNFVDNYSAVANNEDIQKVSDNLKAFLQNFRFVSKTDSNSILYFTIKQDIDSRIYGWDPIRYPIEYDTKRKWVSGEYHDRWEDILDGGINDPAFEYEYAIWGDPIRRYRIRPYYC